MDPKIYTVSLREWKTEEGNRQYELLVMSEHGDVVIDNVGNRGDGDRPISITEVLHGGWIGRHE